MVKLQLNGERRKAAEPKKENPEETPTIVVLVTLDSGDKVSSWKKKFIRVMPYIAMGLLLFQLGAIVKTLIK